MPAIRIPLLLRLAVSMPALLGTGLSTLWPIHSLQTAKVFALLNLLRRVRPCSAYLCASFKDCRLSLLACYCMPSFPHTQTAHARTHGRTDAHPHALTHELHCTDSPFLLEDEAAANKSPTGDCEDQSDNLIAARLCTLSRFAVRLCHSLCCSFASRGSRAEDPTLHG